MKLYVCLQAKNPIWNVTIIQKPDQLCPFPEGAQEYNSLEVSTTPVHLCVQV